MKQVTTKMAMRKRIPAQLQGSTPQPSDSATRIGYFVPEWPSQTHAFFWRELSELRELFENVAVISTKRPPKSACRHTFTASEVRNTYYLFPVRFGVLLGHPRFVATSARILASYITGTSCRLVEKLKLVGLALCAIELALFGRRNGLTHVHGHSCANAAHILSMAERLGVFSYSLTLHGDLEVYGDEHRSKMSGAKFVSAVTRPLADQVRSLMFGTDLAVPVITMGVDTERFTPPSAKVRRQPLVMTTIARLNIAKGHRFALEALRLVRDRGVDVRYIIAGSGPFEDEVRSKISDLRLDEHVQIVGSLGEREVLDTLRSSDIFILPSVGLGEAAPVSVMEAMACGVPCIVSRIGGTEDMITDGVEGLLVEQADVDGLARAIIKLATDERLRTQLGSGGRQRAVQSFEYRALARRLAEEIKR